MGSQAAQPVLEVRSNRQTDGAVTLGGREVVSTGRPPSRAAHLSPENLPMVSQTRELNPRGGRVRKGRGVC